MSLDLKEKALSFLNGLNTLYVMILLSEVIDLCKALQPAHLKAHVIGI